jgi:hypothetical protein
MIDEIPDYLRKQQQYYANENNITRTGIGPMLVPTPHTNPAEVMSAATTGHVLITST